MARQPAASRTRGRTTRDRAESAAAVAGEGPVGRPNAPSLRSLARAHAAAAVEALAAVMRDSAATPAARVSAAGALLAWGYGKAASGDAERRNGPVEQVVRLIWGGDDA